MCTKCTKNKYYQGKAREVTIVVLIILAGITLNAVIGENGIILQAKETKNLVTNETTYDNAQLAQLQNELKDNGLYSGIGIIPGTDTGGGSEGGENGTHTNQGGQTNSGGQGGDNNSQGGTIINPNKNNQAGGEVSGENVQDPTIKVLDGEQIASSFYRSDVTAQILTVDKSQKIKYVLTTTVPEINDELYPSGLVREIDIENGGTLTFTKNGEYTLTAYAYDVYGQKSNAVVMWFKIEKGTTPGNGVTVSVASGNMGLNNWYTSNITIRVLGTDTGLTRVTYRVKGTAMSEGIIGNRQFHAGEIDTPEIEIANGTTFKIEIDGTFSIVAYTYDGNMRLSTSTTLNVQRDASRPIITMYKGEQVLGQGFQITLKAEDHASNLANGEEGEGKAGKRYTYRHKLAPDMTYTDIKSQTDTQLYNDLTISKTYDMYVIVTDNAGNMSASDVISKPALWVSKNEGSIGETGTHGTRTYYQGNIDVSLTGQDRNNVDIKKVTYQITGTATENGTMDGNSYNKGQALPGNEIEVVHNETKTIPVRADGNWTVVVRNYNKENVVVSTNTLEVTRDTVNPTLNPIEVVGTEGEKGYYREGITINISGAVEDTSLKKMVYKVTGTATTSGKVGDRNVSAGNVDTGEITFNNSTSFDITADGTWTVEAVVSDKSGRPTVTRTTTNVRDTVAPTIKSYTGGKEITWNTTTGSTTVTVTNDDFGVSGQATGGGYYYYEGTSVKAQQSSNAYTYTYSTIDKNKLPSKVVAKDKAGNESTITLNKITQINFPYKGQAQSLTLASGKYKLEVWGAQGGTYEGGLGGKGGYSGGTKELDFSAAVSVYVGGEGSSRMGGWNGGGAPWGRAGGGGGGTDVRQGEGSLANRIIVAGGGGGGALNSYGSTAYGGAGGGVEGGNRSGGDYGSPERSGMGASQTNGGAAGTYSGSSPTPGSLGYGGNGGSYSNTAFGGGGGGGGLFGGGGGAVCGSGGGGSGYIGGATNGQTIAGNKSFPAPGGGKETGHSGNGYARITLVE